MIWWQWLLILSPALPLLSLLSLLIVPYGQKPQRLDSKNPLGEAGAMFVLTIVLGVVSLITLIGVL